MLHLLLMLVLDRYSLDILQTSSEQINVFFFYINMYHFRNDPFKP